MSVAPLTGPLHLKIKLLFLTLFVGDEFQGYTHPHFATQVSQLRAKKYVMIFITKISHNFNDYGSKKPIY